MAVEGYTLQAGNSWLTLSAEGKLAFALEGRHVWESTGPLCIVHYYDRQHPRAEVVPVPWDSSRAMGTAGTPSLSAKSTLKIEQIDARTLKTTVVIETVYIRVGMTIAMREDGAGFQVLLDEDNLCEDLPRLYRLLGVEVLPEFGAARTGEAGYLLLPNWFGCQTFFNKSYPREVWQTIYSSNDQWEHVCNMPVYGITRAQGTLCGLVAQGDFDAKLVCRAHWEAAQTNSVHPYLVYRWEQQDERLAGAREVRYAFAPPDYRDGEGYVFCGKEYRAFLRNERGLQNWAEKAAVRPEALDYLDRFFLKIFMAYKDPHPEGKGEYHSTCTFAEAREILHECKARGMTKLTAILVGWGQDGHDGMPPTRFPVDERLGGEAGMRELIAWCKENDILLGVHDSYGASYPCSPEHNTGDLIHHRSGEYWESIIWSGGQAHILCPKIWLEKHARRDIPAIAALGIHGHHHIDAVGSFMTCYSPAHPLEKRADFVQYVRQLFELAITQMGSVSTEMPFGPYFDVVDGFFHSYVHPSPWHRASPIGKWFYDRTAPLLSIALHGSVNCCQSMRPTPDYRLELLDLALSPQYEVCMRPSPAFGIPAYPGKADALAETYQFFYSPDGIVPRLSRLTIEARYGLAPGIHETVYSDGTRVLVNLSDKPYNDLAPGSYTITEDCKATMK